MNEKNENQIFGMPTYVYIIIIAVAALLLAVVIFFIIRSSIKRKKIRKSNEEANKKVEDSAKTIATAFGGKANILSITKQGSRVTLELKDPSLADKEKINTEFKDARYRGNKVTLIIGSRSEEFKTLLEENRK